MRISKPHAGGPNLCLKCRLFIDGLCRWTPGDYCKVTRSK